MTILDAISRTDAFVPNLVDLSEKLRWLSTLDGLIKTEIIDAHGGDGKSFSGYDGSDLQAELLVPAPYDSLYLYWLESQIHYANMEHKKYNNSIELFNTAYATYERHYIRTHRAKTVKMKYF